MSRMLVLRVCPAGISNRVPSSGTLRLVQSRRTVPSWRFQLSANIVA